MSSLKRKIDVMKSPTSLIRFRNAVGVMLALSAIFAVVLSTISLPSDDADAQVADENMMAITERAEAWWNSLNNVQMVNSLRGYEADHDGAINGRQLGDPTRTNTDNTLYYDANGNVVDSTVDGATQGVVHSDVESAQRMFEDLETADQTIVEQIVDGDSGGTNGDIYAVGEHFTDVSQALRGFQSVPQWWAYVDCAEARRSVGEDNEAITAQVYNDPHTDEAETTTEPSAVCEVVGEAGSEVVQVKAYSSLGDAQALVDKVGQALLGLDAPGSPMTADNAQAKAWWNLLSAEERVHALYGDNAQDGDPARDNTDTIPLTRPERAQAMYDGLDTKALVNDRWLWIYNDRGDTEHGRPRRSYPLVELDKLCHDAHHSRCRQRTSCSYLSPERHQFLCALGSRRQSANPRAAGNNPRTRSSHSRHRPSRSGRPCMVEHAEQRPDGLRRLRRPADEDNVPSRRSAGGYN